MSETYGLELEQIGKKIFSSLALRDWQAILSKATLIHYTAGQIVLRQGEYSHGLYIVKSGHLRVERSAHDQIHLLGRRGPGELLGEMSVLEKQPAMAAVIAESAAEVYLVESANLLELLAETPGFAARYYRSLAIHLSGRLRESALLLEKERGERPDVLKDPSWLV